jgi:hypothetical protein
MADRKDARVGCEDSSPLLELPPELLQHVFSAVSAKGHQQLAGTCKAVRTQVLSQTEKLTLPLDRASVIEGSKNKATAALLAAVQRDHADLSLKLSLAKVAPKRILDELAVIGPCPSVTELELANVSVRGKQGWSFHSTLRTASLHHLVRLLQDPAKDGLVKDAELA